MTTSTSAVTVVLGIMFSAINIVLSSANVVLFPTIHTEFAVTAKTNLLLFEPPYGTNNIMANIPQMVATNGLECSMEGGQDWIYLYNHTTNYIICLRMPASNACRIALLDKRGKVVEQTPFGKTFGLPLSQDNVSEWLRHWNTRRQNPLITLIPN